ncbi:amino acid adenylation domain-containing protein [Massilia sp. METH4]|uniref:amino acid adenylation domain-containing protein n=1 Tax=Massilia sp. METH4 TaxID=3123041 RepID=UPI0030CF852F
MNKQDIFEIHRLTPLQQGMLFHTLEAPGSGVYVEQFACPTQGRIDGARWQQAWNMALAAYPVLRAAVAWEGLDHPLLVLMKQAALDVREIDATGDDDAAFAARMDALRREEAARGFDLRRPPLLRQALLHRAGHSVVFWTYHHVLLDGWSAFVVLGALLSAYAALEEGSSWQPRPAPAYRDYLAWLQGRDKPAAERYWRGQLAGFHAPTPLGLVKRPLPDDSADAGATATAELGDALGARLRDTARSLRVTPGTLLQAAWAHLLAIYSGEDDVVFGATVAGRPPELAGSDAMVGLFINTVPVRVRIDPAESVRAFATRLGAMLVAQREHEHASLTDIAGWSEVPRGRPLFDAMLAIESFPYAEGVSLADVSVWQHTNFPLALVIDPVGRMRIKALYDARQFEGAAVAGLLAHYRELLERMVADTAAPLGTLSIAPGVDLALPDGWNHRPAVGDADAELGELFARQVAERPEATALVAGDEHATYAELDLQARRLGARLLAAGVRTGDTVAFAFEPGVPMIAALVAITRLGCAYAPLDTKLPAARLAQMVTDLRIGHVVTDDAHAALFDIAGVTVLLSGRDEHDVPLARWPQAARGRILYVIHTSGSTGKPKAAGVYHDSFTRFIQWWNREFAFGAGERCLLVNKITFDLAQKCVWGALTTGGILHLAPTRHFDPLHARELVQHHGIGWINCTPSMAYAMVEGEGGHAALAPLRLLFVGGEPVDKRRLAPWLLAEGCTTELVNTYGPTECTDLCTTHRFGRDEFVDLDRPVTVGKVLPGLAVHVLDRFGNRLPPGVTGEVAIAGGSVGAGYLNNARMSAAKFLPDPAGPGERLYLTGDLGYFRADGTLVVHGRVDFQVKLRGYRIELDAIGHELRGHPAVLDAVATVTPDGQRLVAYVVPAEGAAWSAALQEACRAWLAARLPEYMVPARFMGLDALPLNANGKLDRSALPVPDLCGAALERIAPRDGIEAKLAGIWAAVLGVEAVGVTDNFFDLGGHSLSITQAYARLQKTFGVRIPLSVLFEQPTIAGQAAALRAAGAAGDGQDMPRQPTILPAQRPAQVPLSFSQSRLWFLHQYDPASMAYHVPNALPLAGVVDRAALQQALDWLHARHESLRTRYPEIDGTPWQEVQPAGPVTLGYDDLREMDNMAGAAERLSAIATAEAAQPFDLQAGPVARYRLVQTDGRGILLVSLHHIATDGWSMDVMMRELLAAYGAFSAGATPRAAPLPIQYADYALWQRTDLAGAKLAKLVDYWREELDGSQPQITLPYDLPRPTTRSSRGGLHVSHLPADVCAALRNVASQSGATAFMAWLAVYDLLLYRWSGQADFNVGSPIANRNLEETEGVIGFFVNTLVLRARVDGGQTFGALLGDVQRTARGAYDHAELPFELLVDELNPPRSANTLPFFQVGFALQRAYEDTSLIDSGEWISRFDLQLALYESADGGLRAHWEYARDLFLPETVARLADSFALLARQVAQSPEAPLREHALIDGMGRERMLALARGSRPALPATTVHALFAQQALLAPAKIALVQGDVQLSYDELNRRANRLAHHLMAQGVAPGAIVGVALPRSPQLIVALLAVLKAGCAYLPLDTEYPRERTAYMLANAHAAAVLTDGDGAGLLPEFGGSLVRVDAPQVAGQRDTSPDVPHDPRSLAYVLYTSGTTGKPKGVMVEHRGIVRLVREVDYADLSAQRIFLQYAPVGFDASTFEIWGALLNGARLVQAPAGVVGLDRLAALLAEQRVDTAFVTAALFNQLVDQHPEGLRGVRQLITGGEVMSASHAARAIAAMAEGSLIHAYGPTECTTYATTGRVTLADTAQGTVPIGRPIPHTDTYVLDDAMEPVPTGVPGELYIGGAGVARGYLNAPQQTAERFLTDPFAADGSRMYRSGDKVRWRADGTLEFLGRMDEQVKIRGYRIEPAEIEAQLAVHDGVTGALVLPLGEGAEKRLVAYVTVIDGSVTPAVLREFLAQRLPAFMVPGAYVILDRWPVNANGKVDRRALPLPDADALGAGEYVAPETALEQSIAAVWAQVLQLERVSVTADFFALGGNSLTATQLLARVRNALGRAVTLPEFFSEPTVRAMAFRIEHAGAARELDAAESRLDGEAESALALPDPLPPLASSLEHVLLTGGTGFVGAYLAAEMLTQWPRVTLHCHVRASHAAAGLRRLRANLEQYGLWRDGFAARIRVLTGDLAEPRLGLDDERYAALARDVDLVVHNASRLNHVLPYQALRHDNVEPTRRLLELAATAKRKGFVHVSTAGVLQGEAGGTYDEDAAIEAIGQSARSGYNASKWVAELMVRRAARAGIPAQIVRLGRVAVDSRSGAGRMDDFVALFVRTCLKVGAWPDRPFLEQIVPVDHVARAVTALAADYTNTGVHHLVGDDKRDWSRLLPDFVDCGDAGLKRLPIRDWVDTVKERSATEPLPFAPYLFWWDTDAAAPEEKRLKVKQAKTARKLAGQGLREPRIDGEAWQRYVGAIFAAEGRSAKPRKRSLFG